MSSTNTAPRTRAVRAMTLTIAAAAAFAHACSDSPQNSGAAGAGGSSGLGAGGQALAGAVGSGGVTAASGGSPGSTSRGASSGGASNGGASNGGASNGGGSSGGASTGGSHADGGIDPACLPATATVDPSMFAECPKCMGQPAHCLPKTLVQQIAPDEVRQLAPCDDMTVCVPDVFTKSLGRFDPPNCTSISGSAGRCLSHCIGAVAALGTFLPQANCAADEKCAPCIDPRDGTETGACSLMCDTGPTKPEVVFDKCCSDKSGICVPPDILDPLQAKALAQSTCGAGSLCAPAKFADSSFIPKACTSVAGAEGRCLSKCVDLVARNAELLPQDNCADGELCAPCTDPRTGQLTAACSLNGDKPTEPPVVFKTQCCDTTGLCVPKDAVPARYSKLLPPDVCGDGDGGNKDYVCAPKIKLNDLSLRLPKCQATLFGVPVPQGDPNQYGACIPQCIADAQIAANPLYGAALAQSDCMAGWVCAPCVNPLDQTRTGACD